jgi:hypothetical protein
MSLTDGQNALVEHIVCNGAGDREGLDAFIKAMSGDMVFKVTPSSATQAAGSTGFSEKVSVKLESADGEVNSWYNGPVTIAIDDTSSAGVASILPAAGSHNMTDGKLDVTLTGSAAAWLAGTKQVETATVVGTVTTAGNASVVVTSASLTGSPKTYSVAVALGDTASLVANKIRIALAADTVLSALYTVSGSGADVVLTSIKALANDSTLNIAVDNSTCAGLTTEASSANTTAGVAAETATLTASATEASLPGLYDVSSGTGVVTIV